MKRLRRPKRLAALFVALGMAALVGGALWRRADGRTIPLPGGASLALEAVYHGTQHSLLSPPWSDLPARTPAFLFRLVGLDRDLNWSTLRPLLGVRLAVHGRIQPGMPRFTLVDERGYEAPLVPVEERTSASRWLLLTDRFPRRSVSLRLRAYATHETDPGSGGSMLLGEWTMANPAPTPTTTWCAESLPVTREDGGLSVTLNRFDLLADAPRAGASLDSVQASLQLETVETGHAAAAWQIDTLEIADAAGNRVQLKRSEARPERWRIETRGNRHAVRFPWPLWGGERAWRLAVELTRAPESPLPAAETWTVHGVRLPARDAITEVNQTTNLQGRSVTLLALVGEHAVLPGREHDVFRLTTAEIATPALPEGVSFRVANVTDDRGRPVGGLQSVGEASFGFSAPEDSKTVDLTLALSRRRRVEFLAAPQSSPRGIRPESATAAAD